MHPLASWYFYKNNILYCSQQLFLSNTSETGQYGTLVISHDIGKEAIIIQRYKCSDKGDIGAVA